jgi:hypothetical protein
MLVPTFNGSSRSKSNCARRTPAVFLDFTERTPAVARGLFLSYLDVLSTSVTLAQPCGLAVDGPFLLSITRSRKLTGGYWSQMFLPFRQCVVPVVTPISVQSTGSRSLPWIGLEVFARWFTGGVGVFPCTETGFFDCGCCSACAGAGLFGRSFRCRLMYSRCLPTSLKPDVPCPYGSGKGQAARFPASIS